MQLMLRGEVGRRMRLMPQLTRSGTTANERAFGVCGHAFSVLIIG
jgi:hypothetical protein